MTKCIICGKRLWFEETRSWKKYASSRDIEIPSESTLYQYNDVDAWLSDTNAKKITKWFHIKCLREKGKVVRRL